MSSELYYFPDIEKSQSLKDSTLSLKMQPGFNKMLDKNVEANDSGMQSIYLKDHDIDEIELAYRKGFKEGKGEGLEAERDRVFDAISILNTALENLEKTNKNISKKIEAMASKLAIIVAGKIIQNEVNANNDHIISTLQKAMSGFEINQALKIILHPDDCDFLNSIAYQKSLDVKTELIPDVKISKGGCIVESNTKTVDARIESQLEIIQNAFEKLHVEKSDI